MTCPSGPGFFCFDPECNECDAKLVPRRAKMFWVVQENIFNEKAYDDLLAALVRLKIPHQVVKVRPFIHTIEPDVFPPDGPVMVMGAYTMWKVAQAKGWSPGAFTNDNFTFEKQLRAWGTRMLNHDSWVGRFADVPPQRLPFFIRPVLDSKSFPGMVTDWPSFVEWSTAVMNIEESPTLTGDTVVQVAPVKPIVRETRFWVVDKKIVTGSTYKVGKRVYASSDVDPCALQFAESCLYWEPARAFCLDIFETEDNHLWVGEINTINAAGFYAADVQKLVAAIDSMEF